MRKNGRGNLLSCYVLSASFLCLCTSPAHAEQWLTGEQIKVTVAPQFEQAVNSYCNANGLKDCPYGVSLQMPDSRRFRILLLESSEPPTITMNTDDLSPAFFTGGMGIASILVAGINTDKAMTLRLPIVLTEKKWAWVVDDSVHLGEGVTAHVHREQTFVDRRQANNRLSMEALPADTLSRVELVKGDVLTQQNVNMPPTVRAWQAVTIVGEIHNTSKPMRVNMKGKALQTGLVGDRIRVRQEGFQQKTFIGIVQENGSVLVRL